MGFFPFTRPVQCLSLIVGHQTVFHNSGFSHHKSVCLHELDTQDMDQMSGVRTHLTCALYPKSTVSILELQHMHQPSCTPTRLVHFFPHTVQIRKNWVTKSTQFLSVMDCKVVNTTFQLPPYCVSGDLAGVLPEPPLLIVPLLFLCFLRE